MLLPFLKDVIVGKKEELDAVGYFTKFRRYIILTITVTSLMAATIVSLRLYDVSQKYIKIEKELKEQKIKTTQTQEWLAVCTAHIEQKNEMYNNCSHENSRLTTDGSRTKEEVYRRIIKEINLK